MQDSVRVLSLRGAVRLVFPPTVNPTPHNIRMTGASAIKFRAGRATFDLPATPRVYRGLKKYFEQGVMIPVEFDEVAERIFEYDRSCGNDASVDFKRAFLAESYKPQKIPKTNGSIDPWDHQARSFWFVVDRLGGLHRSSRGGALIGLDMGCGKSRVAVDLIANYGWKRTLIVCPKKVIEVWPKQFDDWLAGVDITVLPLLGGVKKRAAELSDALKFQSRPLVAVTNYDGFDYKDIRDAVSCVEWDACFLDEGHRIKDPTGKRSRWFGKLADSVPCRFILTGTKEPNSPIDIFAQARWIDRTYYGTRYSEFRSQYAILGEVEVAGKDGGVSLREVRILSFKNEQDLARKNFQFCIEVDADDVQDLPEEHHVNIPVTLSSKLRKKYDFFEKEFVFEVAGEEITAANVMVKLGKLAEITGGYIRNPDTKDVHAVGREKLDMLVEKLSDLPPRDPVVVFYRFAPDADRISEGCDQIGRPHLEVSGRVNELKRWQESDGNEVLICQISAGKEGVDLTRSRWCFYYALGYQPGEFLQSKKRQNRPGQKASRVTFFHLVASSTVDVRIYAAIRKKQRVIDAVREMAKEYGAGNVF